MKFLKVTALLIFISTALYAQNDSISSDTTYWDKGAVLNLNFSQVNLTNWNGGGDNSISLAGLTNFKLNYAKGSNIWTNRLDLAYGILRQGNEKEQFEKTDDNIIFTSMYSRQLKNKFFVSGAMDFRTQFAEGYDDDDQMASEFMAPAFLLTNIGITYRYKKIFSATFSPISSKTTFVLNDSLSNAEAFGVEAGEKIRFEGGLNLASSFQKELWENVNLSTNLNLFSGFESMGNIDVNWETAINFKINKFLSASYSTQLIYDDDIKSKEVIINEATEETKSVAGIQFKSVMNIGLNIKI